MKKLNLLSTILFVVFMFSGFTGMGCRSQPSTAQTFTAPEWSKNVSIYEVNVRQYSEAGTFAEFAKHLPRLKELGVGILWFMPIHPIGEENRKGSLGSYYSVRDYRAVNPEFGTMAEFKTLVRKIHDMGMVVLIDWVANHTAWDNPLVSEHPEWFTKDSTGKMISPVPDWTDVVDLDYDNPGLRRYMIESLQFWLEKADIDGFRCDVAEMVPLEFWEQARPELEKIKPVFMLAEGDDPELHNTAFDMTYDWELFKLMNAIAAGSKTATDLRNYFQQEQKVYPAGAYRMRFITNHDENSWNGTVFERLGSGAKTFATLIVTVTGMPLIYSGQEIGLDKRLAFFESDPIRWRDSKYEAFYKKLLHLRKENRALWNGNYGGILQEVSNSGDDSVFAFVRQKEGETVFVFLNLSGTRQSIVFKSDLMVGEYTELFTDERREFAVKDNIELEPWGYRVFVN